ncbi:MAG: hypothetical protein LAT84_10965 [Balneolia bacterium]|nr:hypothetical protein [Balneolia bacterium]
MMFSSQKLSALFLVVIISVFYSCTSGENAETTNVSDSYPADHTVEVVESEDGWRLMVDGEPFMVNGMNWDYFPPGTNYEYVIWEESDEFIKEALAYEMQFLVDMGVNALRIYTGITPRWIEYIYDEFGIYTMLNHSFGRYGMMLDGEWVGDTDYADPRVREILLSEVREMAEEFKGTRGLLLYLLGNENNYGLFWSGAETEDMPDSEFDELTEERARAMYRLFNDGTLAMKEIDDTRPISMANGDLLFMDQIVEEMPDIDIFGINVYRGISFTDMYDRVKEEYGKPVLLTELGADAFNAKEQREDQYCQAYYKHGNWKEIYMYAAGMGLAGNSIGGFTFQFSDGWWKYGQTEYLDVHNTEASWANAGYQCDYVEGENNMNEEWFGIMAKGMTDEDGFYELFPRAAYFMLKEAHRFDPYADDATLEGLEHHFEQISLDEAVERAKRENGGAE